MDGQESPNTAVPPAHCVKLFGVELIDLTNHQHASMMIRKSVSTGNLGVMRLNALQRNSDCTQPHTELAEAAARPRLDTAVVSHSTPQLQGYASDGLMQSSSSLSLRERKKGVPWTEDEHRLFLAGLQKLGKGDWRGISRNFVTSRTPTQVASHAQKYFLRQGNLNKHKRRSSLFDIINSNLAPRTNVIMRDRSQTFEAMKLVRPPSELRLHSSLLNSVSAYSKAPAPSGTPSVCADLCLGRSHARHWQASPEDVSSVLCRSGKQASTIDALPSAQLFPFKQRSSVNDGMRMDCKNKSICTISSSFSSS